MNKSTSDSSSGMLQYAIALLAFVMHVPDQATEATSSSEATEGGSVPYK